MCAEHNWRGGLSLTRDGGGQPEGCAGSAPASAHWGRSAARHDLGRALRRSGAGSKTAGARGGSGAPSRRTRKSTLARGTKGKRKNKLHIACEKQLLWSEIRVQKVRKEAAKDSLSTSPLSLTEEGTPHAPLTQLHPDRLHPLFSPQN